MSTMGIHSLESFLGGMEHSLGRIMTEDFIDDANNPIEQRDMVLR